MDLVIICFFLTKKNKMVSSHPSLRFNRAIQTSRSYTELWGKRTDTLKIVEDKFSTMHGIYFKFADSMIMYMDQPKHSNKTLLGLINQIYKAAVYKTNTHKKSTLAIHQC